MEFETPVLLIAFNRPDYAKRVLAVLQQVQPKQFFFFQDGAREMNEEDRVRCKEVRRVFEESVSWPCQTKCFVSDRNLGCGPGPAAAISWFFETVDHGIIIEDDTIPNMDFFYYAAELLDKYSDNLSIRAIGSMNIDTKRWGDGSYYFSRMNRNLCAWATWKRAWKDFDISMKTTSRLDLVRALKKYKCPLLERYYWCERLKEIKKDGCGGKSWDMQFFMSIWLNGGKGIIPNVNLSSNIGTVEDATHGMTAGNLIDSIPTEPILPLRHPSSTEVQLLADREFHFRYFEPNKVGWSGTKVIYYIINKSLKRLVGHKGPWIKKKQ